MIIHIVSSGTPARDTGPAAGGCHPVHLPADLRTLLQRAGHQAEIHHLPASAAPGSADGDAIPARASADPAGSGAVDRPDCGSELSYADAARAGAWLARHVHPRPGTVLYAADEVASAAALAARGTTGVPVVVRGSAPARPHPSRIVRQVRQACLRAADAVVAPTGHDLRAVLAAGVRREQAALVPDAVVLPVDPDAEAPAGRPGSRAATVSMLSLTGASAAARLLPVLRRLPGARLVAAGPGDEDTAERLRLEAIRHDVADRFQWLGWCSRDDVVDLLDATDVVICTGPEGIRATTAVEAMLRSRAVVATDRPALADAVAHGTTGIVVRHDDAAALAAALRELHDDPFRREAFGQAGADRAAARYSTALTVTALERVFDAVLRTGDVDPAVPHDLKEAG